MFSIAGPANENSCHSSPQPPWALLWERSKATHMARCHLLTVGHCWQAQSARCGTNWRSLTTSPSSARPAEHNGEAGGFDSQGVLATTAQMQTRRFEQRLAIAVICSHCCWKHQCRCARTNNLRAWLLNGFTFVSARCAGEPAMATAMAASLKAKTIKWRLDIINSNRLVQFASLFFFSMKQKGTSAPKPTREHFWPALCKEKQTAATSRASNKGNPLGWASHLSWKDKSLCLGSDDKNTCTGTPDLSDEVCPPRVAGALRYRASAVSKQTASDRLNVQLSKSPSQEGQLKTQKKINVFLPFQPPFPLQQGRRQERAPVCYNAQKIGN